MESPFATLRRFTRLPAAAERCELCGKALPMVHRHLLEVTTRNVACACDPCALLFQKAVGGRFSLIPRDTKALPCFQMSDAEWEDLALPIGMAFFFHSTPANKLMALYPSAAGATESLLPLAAWETLAGKNPALAALAPDVEALLVNRVGVARDYFIAPIDVCYELVGTIRLHWRGLHGGDEVWAQIAGFFAKLKENARPVMEEDHHA